MIVKKPKLCKNYSLYWLVFVKEQISYRLQISSIAIIVLIYNNSLYLEKK